MSEFQIYQFKSIDRPLSDKERKEVGSWSSRTNPTATSATFTYAYGDLPKSPEKAVEKYFDALLYVSSWGTKRLLFRLPKDLIDPKALAAFTFQHDFSSDFIRLDAYPACYLLDINFSNEEGGGWLSEEDYSVDDLVPLRNALMEGDYRALYLIWLKFAEFALREVEEMEEEEQAERMAPPLPAGMSNPNAALEAFIEFFEIDDDLLAAAKALSPMQETSIPDYKTLLTQLPETERSEWLLRLAQGETRLEMAFKKRLQQLAPPAKVMPSANPSLTEMIELIHIQAEAQQAAAAEAARLAHIQKMDQLARAEPTLWESVHDNLTMATSKSYGQAVLTLKDLHDLAGYQGREAEFKEKMDRLKTLYVKKTSVMKRLKEAKL